MQSLKEITAKTRVARGLICNGNSDIYNTIPNYSSLVRTCHERTVLRWMWLWLQTTWRLKLQMKAYDHDCPASEATSHMHLVSCAGFSSAMLDEDGDDVIYVEPHRQPIFVPSDDEASVVVSISVPVLGCSAIGQDDFEASCGNGKEARTDMEYCRIRTMMATGQAPTTSPSAGCSVTNYGSYSHVPHGLLHVCQGDDHDDAATAAVRITAVSELNTHVQSSDSYIEAASPEEEFLQPADVAAQDSGSNSILASMQK